MLKSFVLAVILLTMAASTPASAQGLWAVSRSRAGGCLVATLPLPDPVFQIYPRTLVQGKQTRLLACQSAKTLTTADPLDDAMCFVYAIATVVDCAAEGVPLEK